MLKMQLIIYYVRDMFTNMKIALVIVKIAMFGQFNLKKKQRK